ncbi:MAG: hypothetical protein ACYC56_03095 [Candidatus Aquicultor sp.]
MVPQSKKRTSLRHKPPFNLKEVVLYGLPFWIGALLAGWYFKGLLGLQSAFVGLIFLGLYVGSSVGFAKKSDQYLKKSAGAVVSITVAGFWIRLIGLWLLAFLVSRIVQLNLLVVLVTIAVGFTVVLAISVKNWLRD